MKLERKIWNYIKLYFNIRSKSLFINGIKRKFDKIYYKKIYNTVDLIKILKELGLRKGANIFIHSSWDEFYNFKGSPKEFIDAIISEIGENGTLLMPAYPLSPLNNNHIIDIKRTPTGAGLIAEYFRRYPGVKRSINIHSVCAYGPMANYFLDEHQFSNTCWDENSPYYKISLTNTLIFSFGLSNSYLPTSYHCSESILREKTPYFKQFFTKKINTRFKLDDNRIIEIESLTSDDDFERIYTKRTVNRTIKRYFDKSKYMKTRISNLTISLYDANYLVNRMIELAKHGKTIYIKPKM